MKGNKRTLIFILILGFCIGFIVGEQTTKYSELNWCVDTGLKILELKGINLDINANVLKAGVAAYHNQVGEFINNARILHN